MPDNLIHVYFMPGMAASSKIFEYIKLPENQFKIHLLDWILPNTNETIEHYALRMSSKITHENPVLIGVSFGGVLVQEISKLITTRKTIIVSSVKSFKEIPTHMVLAKTTKAYKLLPIQLASNIDVLTKYAFGDLIKKRLELYKKYLTMSDARYLTWAIEKMLYWAQEIPPKNIIHIHGDNDSVFPIKNINNCIIVASGTHSMIINKCRWFNENLPNLILKN